MRGITFAQSITSSTDSLHKEYIALQSKYQKLLAEFDQIKIENDIYKVIIGE
jgi:hypothetical protein